MACDDYGMSDDRRETCRYCHEEVILGKSGWRLDNNSTAGNACEAAPRGYHGVSKPRKEGWSVMSGAHPRGNFWFVDQLTDDDEYFDPKRPMWGVFLQLPGLISPMGTGFYSAESAGAFIRDDILGAGAEIGEHKTVPGEVVRERPALTQPPTGHALTADGRCENCA